MNILATIIGLPLFFLILNPCLLLNGPHALFIAHTRAQRSSKKPGSHISLVTTSSWSSRACTVTSSAPRALQNNKFLGSAPITGAKARKKNASAQAICLAISKPPRDPRSQRIPFCFLARLPHAFTDQVGELSGNACFERCSFLCKAETADPNSPQTSAKQNPPPLPQTSLYFYLCEDLYVGLPITQPLSVTQPSQLIQILT